MDFDIQFLLIVQHIIFKHTKIILSNLTSNIHSILIVQSIQCSIHIRIIYVQPLKEKSTTIYLIYLSSAFHLLYKIYRLVFRQWLRVRKNSVTKTEDCYANLFECQKKKSRVFRYQKGGPSEKLHRIPPYNRWCNQIRRTGNSMWTYYGNKKEGTNKNEPGRWCSEKKYKESIHINHCCYRKKLAPTIRYLYEACSQIFILIKAYSFKMTMRRPHQRQYH